MTKRVWVRDSEEHIALAQFMFDRTCEQYAIGEVLAEVAWDDEATRNYWLEESWAVVVFIYRTATGTGQEETAKKKYLGPEWKVPHLCEDGIHDFAVDEDLDLTYCHKCDYWQPEEVTPDPDE